ncbi:MAG: DUF4395 domain-containing protein [Chloroflexi bacterium]|nr:DUF4395 domain-containing protein [Chloroflexota bacterium]
METAIEDDTNLRIIPSIAGGSEQPIRQVDQSALRVNQALIISLLVLAFVFNLWWLVAFVSAVMIIGTIWPDAALFKLIYKNILKPANLVEPDVIPDNPEPHRFAQALGGLFTFGSAASLLLGLPALGWTLAWVVIVLAGLNLFLGFCVGCFVYYQFNRLGVPGFSVAPIPVEVDQER